jgi:HSP20 family protein
MEAGDSAVGAAGTFGLRQAIWCERGEVIPMRLRFRSVTYSFGGASQSLERHYRELREELLRQGRHYSLIHMTGQWRPPVDTHETPEAILVKIELAGMREENIEITLYENALVVSGMREDDADHDEGICYHEAQVRYGPFRAEILLPTEVRGDAAEATYVNGFLRVRLPKMVPGEPGSGRKGASGEHERTPSGATHLNAAPAGLLGGHGGRGADEVATTAGRTF